MSKAQQLVEQGLLLHRQGRAREATGYFQQALVAQAGFGPALYYLGLSMAQQGMADMGRAMVEQALAAGEDHADLRLDLGAMYERRGQWEVADRHYARACELGPDRSHAWEGRARVAARRGEVETAEQALTQLVALQPDHAPFRLALARHAWQQNDVTATRQHFNTLLAAEAGVLQQAYLGFAEPEGAADRPDPYDQLQRDAAAGESEIRAVLAGADLVILDDFLPEPDAVRAWAAELSYTEQGGNYPGRQTGPLRCDELMQQIANRLGRRIKWSSPDNGVVRLTLADATARNDIHVDDETAIETQRYAAVLYLTRPEHCQGGTSFWQHRATGWLRRPDEATLRAAGYADFRTFLRRETPLGEPRPFEQVTALRAGWQHLFTVPMRYNRLVLYKGHHFHAVDSVFGHDFGDGRLTRLMTFETW
ncbi:DUF6445 family protein [Chitinimonas sp.]|uniref:DUF6445 family protein n=1 Tax=Chitinimonas sp. TaxID=1934313 RepID=UPI002F95F5E2